jgi:hypothetical protein
MACFLGLGTKTRAAGVSRLAGRGRCRLVRRRARRPGLAGVAAGLIDLGGAPTSSHELWGLRGRPALSAQLSPDKSSPLPCEIKGIGGLEVPNFSIKSCQLLIQNIVPLRPLNHSEESWPVRPLSRHRTAVEQVRPQVARWSKYLRAPFPARFKETQISRAALEVHGRVSARYPPFVFFSLL